MSLTGFLKQPDVKAEFSRRFPLPYNAAAMMPRVQKVHDSDPALVGIATDWVVRTILLRNNPPGCGSQQWLNPEINRVLTRYFPEKLNRGREISQAFTTRFSEYLYTPVVTRELAAAALGMATLERVYRGSDPEASRIGEFSDEDLEDTLSISRAFRPSVFDFVEEYHLNPDFGEASASIGGADADLVVRSRSGVWGLVDFKSTRYPGPKEDDYHQLLGYAILNEWCERFPTLAGGCTFFTRTNRFQKYDLAALFRQGDYPAFMDWFRTRLNTYSRGYNYLNDIKLRTPGVLPPG